MSKLSAFKGNIVFTPELGKYEIIENGYIVIDDKTVVGTFEELPSEYAALEMVDFGDKLVIPGFVDLHLHAPQFANRGLGLDKELLDWLKVYTFPEESKYANLDFAEKAYKKFVHEVWKAGTTRAVVFATLHNEATIMLMDIMDRAGLGGFVGKVNMDRNCPDFYIEDTKKSLEDTRSFIEATIDRYERIKPIVTPRFVPTCSSELMNGLGGLAREYGLKVQSHLSENRGEVAWVKELHPEFSSYAEVYDRHGLFGGDIDTVMAHCVWNTSEEMELMARNKVFVAHSPYSNTNLSSGIAPVREFISKGIPVGLATDISGGHDISMTSVMSMAAQMSKMRWVYVDDSCEALTTPELFYLATKGGGAFLGSVGSFEPGYEFDALVIDDSNLTDANDRSIAERLERYIYIGDDRNILERYVAGRKLEEPEL